MSQQLDVINTFFKLAQNLSVDAAAYAEVLHPEVRQTEFPNSLHKTAQHRSFAEMLDQIRAGRELLRDSSFEVQGMRVCPDGSVVVEGRWEATTTCDVGPLVRGQRMSSQLCSIFEFKDGKIYRQREYICYEQF